MISWGWPIIEGAAATVSATTVAAVAAVPLVLMLQSDAPPSVRAKAKPKDTTYSKNPICDLQYKRDLKTCGRLPLNQRSACYAQAMERLIACEQGKPLPPLPF